MPSVSFDFTDNQIQRTLVVTNTIETIVKPNGNTLTRIDYTPSAWARMVWLNMLHTLVVDAEKRIAKLNALQGVDVDSEVAV